MKILVTGAKGFIAKNLIVELHNRGYQDIFLCDSDTEKEQLDEYLNECDVIVHLAGVNRPENEEEFYSVNEGFTEYITDYLVRNNRSPYIIFSSSIQAELDNAYGVSKQNAENVLIKYKTDANAEISIFRFPNVFGKWCRPNYNSVVATFCHNVANGKDICIHDENARVQLVYIDDVVDTIITQIETKAQKDIFVSVSPIYNVTVGQLADLIYSFRDSRMNLQIPNVSDEFEKKLYSTYLSYLDINDFSYKLKMNEDVRGSFTEFIHTEAGGQVSVNIAKPGITKGNHWHHTKVEKFLVVKGQALIQFRHMITNEKVEYKVSGDVMEVVDIPVGYTHNIKNIGEEDLVTVMWANECFNPDKPDTFFEVV